MSMSDPGDRSAAEIEREVERTRARLIGTAEELKERVSPGQVAEQAMDWLRGSGGREFLGNLGTTLRDNPMPVLLVAAGIGWLALSGTRGDGRARTWSRDNRTAPPVEGGEGYAGAYPGESYPPETHASQGTGSDTGGPSLRERAGETVEEARRHAADLAHRASGAASEAWEGATSTAHSIADTASATGRQAARRAGEAWHTAADAASGLGHRAAELGSDAGRRVYGAVEQQPLVLGAVGLALGAALGALLPPSEAEDRLMGEARDRAADRISSLAGEAYHRARDTAGETLDRAGERLGETYERTKERVAGSGVSAAGGASALGEVARDLRQAVERTAQEVTGAARDAVERPEDDATKRAAPGTPPPGGNRTGGASTGMPPSRSGPESGGPV